MIGQAFNIACEIHKTENKDNPYTKNEIKETTKYFYEILKELHEGMR